MPVEQKGKRWYYSFMIDKRRYHRACKGATSYKEAVIYENELKSAIMHGDLGLVKKKSTVKLADMITKYLDYSKNSKASYTHDKTYSKYWLEYFGNKLLSDIKQLDVASYRSFRLNQKIKPSTVNREINSLSGMFRIAKKSGYVEDNPCSGLNKLRIDNNKIRYLTKEEEQRLFKVIGNHWIRPIIITALQTGLRKSEILNLKWDCVNFTQNYIDILKTKNGKERKIVMSAKLRNVLENQPKVSEYVFVNPITKNRHSNIQDVFADFLKKAKIKNFRFHDLRHTVATRMVERGIDLVVVKEILGHSNINTTMIYAHAVTEVKLKAVEVLNNY